MKGKNVDPPRLRNLRDGERQGGTHLETSDGRTEVRRTHHWQAFKRKSVKKGKNLKNWSLRKEGRKAAERPSLREGRGELGRSATFCGKNASPVAKKIRLKRDNGRKFPVSLRRKTRSLRVGGVLRKSLWAEIERAWGRVGLKIYSGEWREHGLFSVKQVKKGTAGRATGSEHRRKTGIVNKFANRSVIAIRDEWKKGYERLGGFQRVYCRSCSKKQPRERRLEWGDSQLL